MLLAAFLVGMGNVPLDFERKTLQLDEGEKVKEGQRHRGTWLYLYSQF